MEQEAVKLLLRRGRPMGIETLASQLGVDLATYRDVHEPWLERSGLVERTGRGQAATEKAPFRGSCSVGRSRKRTIAYNECSASRPRFHGGPGDDRSLGRRGGRRRVHQEAPEMQRRRFPAISTQGVLVGR